MKQTSISVPAVLLLMLSGCSESVVKNTAPNDANSCVLVAKVGPRELMPIYVEPFYNSDVLQIDVGAFSEQLSSSNIEDVEKCVKKMSKEWKALSVEAMYVVAIRLYDLGLKDQAVYWFYSAQYRSRLFQALLDLEKVGGVGSHAFELKQAFLSFHTLAGEYINGYAFGHTDKLRAVISRIAQEGQELPDFQKIYPHIKFIPKEQRLHENDEIINGLMKLEDYIANNAEEIKAQRKASGIEGKY